MFFLIPVNPLPFSASRALKDLGMFMLESIITENYVLVFPSD